MPRSKVNIPANETDAQRFVRLANQRVNVVLAGLKAIGQLGNKNQYESKPEQHKKIKEALEGALSKSMEQLSKGGEAAADFKL